MTPLGRYVSDFPAQLEIATQAIPWFECLLPVLLFLPVGWQRFRLLAIAVAIGFHLSIALMLNIWSLGIVCVVFWVLFLPPLFWDSMNGRFRNVALRAEFTSERYGGRTVLVLGLAVLAIMNNLSTITGDAKYLPQSAKAASRFVGIEQSWNMFAPTVLGSDYWPILTARLADGSKVDLFRNGSTVVDGKPQDPTFPNLRWQCLFYDALRMNNRHVYGSITSAFVRKWNQDSPKKRVLSTELLIVRERTLDDGNEAMVTTSRKYRQVVPPPLRTGPRTKRVAAPWIRRQADPVLPDHPPSLKPTPDPAFSSVATETRTPDWGFLPAAASGPGLVNPPVPGRHSEEEF